MLSDEVLSSVWKDLVESYIATEGMLELVVDCFDGNKEKALDKVIAVRTPYSNAEEYAQEYGYKRK